MVTTKSEYTLTNNGVEKTFAADKVQRKLDAGWKFVDEDDEEEWELAGADSGTAEGETLYQEIANGEGKRYLSSTERKALMGYVAENFSSFALPSTEEYAVGKEFDVTAVLVDGRAVCAEPNPNNKSKVSVSFRAKLPNGAAFNVNARNITDAQENVLLANGKLKCVVVSVNMGGNPMRFLNIK